MKTTIKLFLLLCIGIALSGCGGGAGCNIVGEWEGEIKSKPTTLIFNEDGSYITIKGNKVSSSSEEKDGKSAHWEVDCSKTPHYIDIVITDEDKQEEIARMKGLWEFLSENKVRFYIAKDMEKALVRPDAFDENKTVVLTRVK